MYTLPESISNSLDWKRRIGYIKRKAKYADEGSTFFLQVSNHPVVSLFIVTGAIDTKNRDERLIHLHFEPQPDTYPNLVTSTSMMETMGYNDYMSSCRSDETIMDKEEYKKKFYACCEDIDKSIKVNHGVKCYEDGDSTNNSETNVFYLHVCDILHIMISKSSGVPNNILGAMDEPSV